MSDSGQGAMISKSRASCSSPRIIVYGGITLLATIALLSSTHLGSRNGGEIAGIRGDLGDGGLEFRGIVRGKASVVEELTAEEWIDGRIQEVVAFPDDEFLLVVSGSSYRDDRVLVSDIRDGFCRLEFSASSSTIELRIVDNVAGDGGRRMIRCRAIEQSRETLPQSSISNARIKSRDGMIAITSGRSPLELRWWNKLVFASLATDEDVILFSKGIFSSRKEDKIHGSRCVFFNRDGAAATHTRVISIAQEIIRCEYPPPEMRPALAGNKVSVAFGNGDNGEPAPSVAVFSGAGIFSAKDTQSRHLLCACTMVHNVAKFLPEWTHYHSHLGVEKFVLYDNNSEDEIEAAVEDLGNGHGFLVERVTWPWMKTQEAGFSHCATRSRGECRWMAFVDVDEFVFPNRWLRADSAPESRNTSLAVGSSPLTRLIAAATAFPAGNVSAMVGQISLHCRDFGPSGQTRNPTAGVTVGYTCRAAREQRHKSLVLLDAVDYSLVNAIHHFKLSQRYMTQSLPASKGVVNHYKFQAWEEFRHKFERRASAYVADWTESKNSKSQDRTPGLGNKAEKPADWEQRFCDVQDTGLRDYVLDALTSQSRNLLPW